jgi:uncharacterized protein YndB with AHSA1/START domain
MTDTRIDELAFSVDLPHPPEKVWRALTIRAFCERWLLKRDGRARGLDRHVEITVVDAEPLRRLTWLWQEDGEAPACVTITLTQRIDGGTRLDLVHQPRFVSPYVAVNCNGPLALAA